MVFFFKSINPKYILYMGRDKMENEDLIKHSLPIDVWFHVDGLSSAHVYARLPDGTTIDDIPADVLVDCAQLTKANSISGNKENNVRIVYTPAPNLKKTAAMADGQVSFHEQKQCKYTRVEKRVNEIVNRLDKTRVEKPTEIIIQMREKYEKIQKQKRKKEAQQREQEEKEERERRAKEKEARDYGKLMKEENITTNAELADAGVDVEEFEDGFM